MGVTPPGSMQTNFYVDRTEKVSLFILKTIPTLSGKCLFKLAFTYLRSKQAEIRGGLAVELGPGRFDSEGGLNYASGKFGGHSLGKFFVDTPPGLDSKYT